MTSYLLLSDHVITVANIEKGKLLPASELASGKIAKLSHLDCWDEKLFTGKFQTQHSFKD